MRKINYVCDVCQKEFNYSLQAEDNERGILRKIKNYELCGDCFHKVLDYICQLKLQSPTI